MPDQWRSPSEEGTALIYRILPLILIYVFVIHGLFLYSSFKKQLTDVFLFFGFKKSFLALAAVIGRHLAVVKVGTHDCIL